MIETIRNWKQGWENAFYRVTMCYIAILVTVIFSLQIYRYFFDLPSSEATCGQDKRSIAMLVPIVGVLLDAKP